MAEKHVSRSSPETQGVRRRDFIKLAVAAGLMAGCRSALPSDASPEVSVSSTPEPTSTSAPTATPIPVGPSKVIRARHPDVWDGDALVPDILGQMLDASITELTGLSDVNQAWASLFSPTEKIAIKVNTIQGSSGWTHVPLVTVVTERLQNAGIPSEQIVVFDRDTGELVNAGFAINRDGPGTRCYGTDNAYTFDKAWKVMDTTVSLSNIFLECDALINMPILKQHMYAGISFAMKNHYGTFNKPRDFHSTRAETAIAELNALPPIQERARLVVGDVLLHVLGDYWNTTMPGDAILMSLDPVAHDAIGLQMFREVMADRGSNSERYENKAIAWLENSVALGLGTHDLDQIDLVEVALA